MKNESPLPQAPHEPRKIPYTKAMAYGWSGLLFGAIFVVDALIMAAIFGYAVGDDFPVMLTIGLPILFGGPGLLMLTVALTRIQKRRSILESGRATQGRILSCHRKKGWNPPPWVLTFEAEDPMSGRPVQGTRWFMPPTWTKDPPSEGQPCLVVIEEGMSTRVELLAVLDWQAWTD